MDTAHPLALYALVVAPTLGKDAQQQRAGFLPVYCCGRQQLLRRGACTGDGQTGQHADALCA